MVTRLQGIGELPSPYRNAKSVSSIACHSRTSKEKQLSKDHQSLFQK